MASPPADKSNLNGSCNSQAAQRKRRDRIELLVTYGLILLAVWTPLPWQRFISLAALAWVMLVTWLSFDDSREMGLRGPGFHRSLWVAGAALLMAAAAVLVAARMQTLHAPATAVLFVQRYWAYTIWSFLQEFLLLNFFLLRLLRLLPGRECRSPCGNRPVHDCSPAQSDSYGPDAAVGMGILPALSSLSQPLYAGHGARNPGNFHCHHDSRTCRPQYARRIRLSNLQSEQIYSPQPDGPDRIHAGMGDGGCAHTFDPGAMPGHRRFPPAPPISRSAS